MKATTLPEEKKERKELFLKELKECKGNIQMTCHKLGLRSRTTFYNWKKEDEEFKKKAEKILAEELEEMNDFVEGILFTLIKSRNIAATIFYLKCRHPKYCPKQLLEIEAKSDRKLTDEEKKLKEKAIDYARGQIQKEDIRIPELQKVSGE